MFASRISSMQSAKLRPFLVRPRGLHHHQPPRSPLIVRSSSADYGTQDDEKVEEVKQEIEALEFERLEASEAGNSLARKGRKLNDTILSLQEQAFQAVKAGDEETARALLRSKAQTQQILEKTTERSRANLELSAKLEQVIGKKQTELIALLAKTGKIRIESTFAPSSSAPSEQEERPSGPQPAADAPPSPSSPSATPSTSSKKDWEQAMNRFKDLDDIVNYDPVREKFESIEQEEQLKKLRNTRESLERMWKADGGSGSGPSV